MEQRLQKLLASAGIASRRSCEALIAEGRVTVNGQKVTEPGTKADPDVDDIRVNGKPISSNVEHIYIALNKPTGYVSTVSDRHADHTIMELVRAIPGRLYPVGRLDADSAGLLLLTNDGAFTERMTHPSHQVPKTYRVVVRGEVPEWVAADLSKGILLEDGMTAPAVVEWIDFVQEHNTSIIDITIHEGRNRQVRRMFEAVGYPVLALTRMQIGPIVLKGLAPGTWRKLFPSEVQALLDAADSTEPSLPQSPYDKTERETEKPAPKAEKPAPKIERPAPRAVAPPQAKMAPVKKATTTEDTRAARPKAPMPARPRTAPRNLDAEREAELRAAAQALTRELRAAGPDEVDDGSDTKKHVPTRPGHRKPKRENRGK
jgi:23S rRNA pseudouridine2605 synthase